MSRKTKIRNIKLLALILGASLALAGCQHNLAPIADAGNKTTVYMEDIVQLNGSLSRDPDGDQLEYQWAFSIVPDGSSPYLENADSAYASFLPDMPGIYILELRVFDGELYSGRDHVLIKVTSDVSMNPQPVNPILPGIIPIPPPGGLIPPPMIEPMHPPYTGLILEDILIQGSMQDMTDISVEWVIINKPADSIARYEILDTDTNEIAFSANQTGNYTLLETIFHGSHVISKTEFDVLIVEKRVDAGPDKFVGPDTMVDLNFGYFATLPPVNADVTWRIINKPELSEAKILNANSYGAQFIPDMTGIYEINVLVAMPNDGPQDEDSIIITVSEEYIYNIDHFIIDGQCMDCHDGLNATGKSATHIESTDNCESCHGIISWVPARIDHSQIIGTCADCHNNIIAMGKNAGHITSTEICEACHTTASFQPTIFVDHSQVIGTCESCHNSVIAAGKSSTHADTSNNCIECHNTTNWIPTKNSIDPLILPHQALDINLETSAASYQIGELIKATAILTNTSDFDIELIQMSRNASPLQIEVSGNDFNSLTLYNPNDPPFDTPVLITQTLKAGDSITREVVWDQMLVEGGLTASGNYTLEAYVITSEPGTINREKIGLKTDINIEHPADLIGTQSAILSALEEPSVKTWYEDMAKDITCRLDKQFVKIIDYKITPIQTLVAIPEADIQCHAELTHSSATEWNVYFHNNSGTNQFSYHVILDALTSEIKMGMAM